MGIKKIIKEELLKHINKSKNLYEAGGYDDPQVMATHAGKIMGALSNSYNDLSDILQKLANAVMNGDSKEYITDILMDASKGISFLVDVIKTAIKDFTEDDLINKAKMVIKSLNSFKRKIDVLSNFSDAMGTEEEFIERLKILLMDLIPTLQEYGEQLKITNQLFSDRLSGMGWSSLN